MTIQLSAGTAQPNSEHGRAANRLAGDSSLPFTHHLHGHYRIDGHYALLPDACLRSDTDATSGQLADCSCLSARCRTIGYS